MGNKQGVNASKPLDPPRNVMTSTYKWNQMVNERGVRASKPLLSLVNDHSDFVEKIFQHLDTPTRGAGHHEVIAKYFGFEDFEIRWRCEKSFFGLSRAGIKAISVRHPKLTVEEFARVMEKQAGRKDVADLLRKYDHDLLKASDGQEDEEEEEEEEEYQQQEYGKPTKKKEKKTGKESEQLEEEEDVILTSDGESETASEDENEFLGDFSNTNYESFVLYRGEAVAYCFIKRVGIHLISPPGAVADGSVSTVRRWNPRFRSPLLFDNEAVVSDVIELSLDIPGALHFDKAVTLVIPHCASALKGYEVVVKCLSSGDEWKDVETADWRTKSDIKEEYDLSGYAPDFSFPVAACKITQCSTFAVVCRLKSHRHVVTSQESELVWPEFPLAKVTFPQNAVPQGESFEVIAQLQEVCQRPFRQKQILPGPILRITSSKAVDFLKPIAVQLPLSLSEPHRKDIDMSVARVHILFKESSSEKKEWIEVTEKLETLPRFDGNVITFAVSHFSDFCTWVDRGPSTVPFCWHSNPAVESAIINSNNVPKAAFFAVFVRRNTCLYRKTQLRLYCVPTCKRCELNDYEEKLKSILIGDGSSDKPMCSNEKAYVFLSEGIVAPLKAGRLQGLHVSLQEDPFLKTLKVRVVNRGELTISFCGRKERDEGNMLCEVDVTLPPSDKKGDERLRHMRDHLTEGHSSGVPLKRKKGTKKNETAQPAGTSSEPEITAQGVEGRKRKRKPAARLSGGFSPRVARKKERGIFEMSKSEQPAGTSSESKTTARKRKRKKKFTDHFLRASPRGKKGFRKKVTAQPADTVHEMQHEISGTSSEPEITAQGVEARKQKRRKNITDFSPRVERKKKRIFEKNKREQPAGHSSRAPLRRRKGIQKKETAQPAASDDEEEEEDEEKEKEEEEEEEEEEDQPHEPTKKNEKKTGKVSKSLENLINDPSTSLDEICKRLDTPTPGLGNYENIAKHYGYDVYTISRFNSPPYSPSKAMILTITAEHPDVTVESFARVVVEQTRRQNVAILLREFDRK